MHASPPMRSRRMHRSRSPLPIDRHGPSMNFNEYFHQSDPRQFYTTISVRNLSPNLSDIDIQKLCFKKFSKYGSISIKVYNRGYDRVVWIHFTNYENARKARHAKSDLVWDNMLAIVEPVYPHEIYSPPEPVRYPAHRQSPSSPPRNRPHHHSSSKQQPRRIYPSYAPYPVDLFDHSNKKSTKRHRSSSSSNHRSHSDFESDIQQEPTRTIIVENLPKDIAQPKLQDIFGRFGAIQELDLKKSSKHPSATIRYENMDMAYEARRLMNGEYIGKSTCQIRYDRSNYLPKLLFEIIVGSKLIPSKYLWVGNIPPDVRRHHLEHAFARYGQVKRIDHEYGDPVAIVTYLDVDDAVKARSKLNGAQPTHDGRLVPNESSSSLLRYGLRIDFLDRPTSRRFVIVRPQQKSSNHHRSRSSTSTSSAVVVLPVEPVENIKSERQSPETVLSSSNSIKHRRSTDRSSTSSLYDPAIPIAGRTFHTPIGSYLSSKETEHIQTLNDLMILCEELNSSATKSNTALSTVYPVQFHLKSDVYDARLHFLAGSPTLASILLGQPGDLVAAKTELKITQRLRLDQQKLDDLERKLRTSVQNALDLIQSSVHSTGLISRKQTTVINQTKFSLLIAVPKIHSNPKTNIKIESSSPTHMQIKQEQIEIELDHENDDENPLSRLISYLIEKQAAGVISVPFYPTYSIEQSPRQETAVLHIFPPCQFSQKILQLISPSIQFSSMKTNDEHLMLLIVHNE